MTLFICRLKWSPNSRRKSFVSAFYHLSSFIPGALSISASREGILCRSYLHGCFSLAYTALWSYFYPKAGWTYVLWYPSYFFCCGLVPPMVIIHIFHPKIKRKLCILNKSKLLHWFYGFQKSFVVKIISKLLSP